MDEPLADPACFPLRLLCKQIKPVATVVLSGEGSDELFAGYGQYDQILESKVQYDFLFSDFLGRSHYFANRDLPLSNRYDLSRLWLQRGYFLEQPLLSGMQAYDMKTWLPENLMMKADKILMSQSLEGRFPFLSKDLVEFAFALPAQFKVQGGIGKQILRKAFADVVPKSIQKRPKMGFSVPIEALLMKMRERLNDRLSDFSKSSFSGLLNREQIHRELAAHFSGVDTQPLWVWTLLVLLEWESSYRIRRSSSRLAAA